MFSTEFNVLLVDDEPDVLSISRLALRGLRVYGVPLKLHLAESKAKAVEILSSSLATQIPGTSHAAVAFVDVVMETDHAGLELCQEIREGMGNAMTQIYIRTGQPGVAPERTVIDRYDINGYFSKVEATEAKLYSFVKSGIRQYYVLGLGMVMSTITHALIEQAGSRAGLAAVLGFFANSLQLDPAGNRIPGLDIRIAFLDDDKVVAGNWGDDAAEALSVRDRLLEAGRTPLGPGGDTLSSDGNDFAMRIAATSTSAPLTYLARGTAPAPAIEIPLHHGLARDFAALWQAAG